MEGNKLTKKKFIKYIENLNSEACVKITILPNKGWEYELCAHVTNIVFEPEQNTIYISNAFSDKDSKLTVEEILEILYEDEECEYIVFEIYGYNNETNTNEQILYSSSNNLMILNHEFFGTDIVEICIREND